MNKIKQAYTPTLSLIRDNIRNNLFIQPILKHGTLVACIYVNNVTNLNFKPIM